MKKLILIFFTFVLITGAKASITDSLYFGVAGGYSNYNTFKGEFYLKKDLTIFNRHAELRAGMNNRNYQLDFDNVKDLKASSVGFFGDVVIYPFKKGFFAGLRWELINFNWLSNESKQKIENERNYTATSFYTGTCGFLQVGYRFKLGNNTNLKIYGQPGFQQYKISNGSNSSGGFVQSSTNTDIKIEDRTRFIYDLNMSFEFRLGK
ncbi:MAG: hypothetical protein Q7W54_11185 [Bacteroidota bacterium]|nr:hypothetical protein [Bacteroidota bacterium]